MDHRIIEYIQRMVGAGVTSLPEMRLHVERFVSAALFDGKPVPDLSNRRYFPEDNDIRYLSVTYGGILRVGGGGGGGDIFRFYFIYTLQKK